MNTLRTLLNLALLPRGRDRLSVIDLHRVLPGHDPLFPEAMHVERFSQLCGWLSGMFTVLPLDVAVRRLAEGSLPERALAITFDDGYADNLQVAMPVLQRHGLSATVFVTTGFLDGGCMWNDVIIESFRRTRLARADLRGLVDELGEAPLALQPIMQRRDVLNATVDAVKYLPAGEREQRVRQIAERLEVMVPTDLMMSSQQVRELRRGGLLVGAHTVTHPILAKLSDEEARQEIRGSKGFLEQLLGERVGFFAYPNGKPGIDYDERIIRIVREIGFDAAFSCARGAASPQTDRLQIPRFTPWDRTPLRFGLRMVRNIWSSIGPTPTASHDLATRSS
jgi:peptidoglycan/xylan/chitin deacetylase (PgdA/CDA1 family)